VVSPKPVAVFASCCYPVNIDFFYLAGKDGLPQVDWRIGHSQKDGFTLLPVLGFFFPMAAAMIILNDTNK